MRQTLLRSLFGLLILSAVAAVGVACAPRREALVPPPPSAPGPLLGQPAPAVDGEALDGQRLARARGAAGEVVVVEFFAEYCAPCQRRLPEAARVARRFPRVVVVGVSLDETREAAQAATSRHRLPFAVIHDASRRLAGRFRVGTLPVTVVIDRAGVVRWLDLGDQPPGSLERVVDVLEAERPESR